MSTYKRKKLRKQMKTQNDQRGQPWISMKSGRRIVWMVSLMMAVLVAFEVIPQRGPLEGVLWGLLFGGMILLIFEGYYRLNRLLRRIR